VALANDHALASIIATNPNTPWETLSVLAVTHPRQVLDNPVLPLLLLAEPDLAAGMDYESVSALLRYADIPLSFLYSAANHPDPRVHGMARAHVALAGEVGDDWADITQRVLFSWGTQQGSYYRNRMEVRFQSAGFVPQWLLSACVQRGGEGYEAIRAFAALSPDLSRAEYDALVNDASPVVCCNAARNRHAPPEVLYHLAHSQSVQIRLAVVSNPSAPPVALKVLAGDSREDVRSALARHPHLPAELCRELARDGRENVRRALATNTNTPADVLIALAGDKHVAVRCVVAEHPMTPPAILAHVLLHGDDWRACYAALQNPHTPVDALQRLANEGAHHVKSENAIARAIVARNPYTPEDLLQEIEKDTHTFVRAALAKNPEISTEILRRLAADSEALVRIAAADNARLPPDALRPMVNDHNMLVRSTVARHPDITRGMLDLLAEDAFPYVCRVVAHDPRTLSDIRVKAAIQQAGDENNELPFKFWIWMRSQPEMTTELSDTLLSRLRHSRREIWLS
ncbi:MAG TPA: hypothetical protein VKB76_08505, partial [Ktedonobacterales bacterium]|nr:hypothetical protein [Ktedonobacterales bacterium]